MWRWLVSLAIVMVIPMTSMARGAYEKDVISTSKGNLEITFIGHGSLMFRFDGKTIHVDPWSRLADYSKLPVADIILLTHAHQDHLDLKAITDLRTDITEMVMTEECRARVDGGIVMMNGDVETVKGIRIKAVPAYNTVHMRGEGIPFHPEGIGNGYVISFGDRNVYVAGDTENIPEMKALTNINIAFLPMNLPYTMTPEMAADAAKTFRPDILYPYHYGDTDTSKIVDLLKNEKIEVRIRKMK